MTSIQRSALVAYTDEEMFRLVADIPAYPQFLPWCGGARVVSQTEDEVVAAITIAYGAINKIFTTRNLLQAPKMMEIRLVDGPFRHLQGFWRFERLPERGSKISLDLDFEVANRLFASVLTPVFSTLASQMVDAFHGRALALYGKR